MTPIQALRIFNKVWEKTVALNEVACECDAKFDAGEWSGPAHARAEEEAFEKTLAMVAQVTGVSVEDILNEMHNNIRCL
jgi:hypothetical protein